MSKFEFKLDKVLELRQQEEKLRAERVARAQRDAQAAREAMENLSEIRRTGRERLTKAHGTTRTVGQLQNLEWVMGRVEQELEAASDAYRDADSEVQARLSDFQDAVRDRQAIDKLRERRFENWKAEQTRSEQRAMDEVALTRHARAQSDSTVGSES